jgi:hypothetical protein
MDMLSSSSLVARENGLQFLLEVCSPCLDFDVLKRLRLDRRPVINEPPPSSVLFISSSRND